MNKKIILSKNIKMFLTAIYFLNTTLQIKKQKNKQPINFKFLGDDYLFNQFNRVLVLYFLFIKRRMKKKNVKIRLLKNTALNYTQASIKQLYSKTFYHYLKSFQINNMLINNKVRERSFVNYSLKKLPKKKKENSKLMPKVLFWEDFYNTLPLSSFLNKKITIINFNIATVFFEAEFAKLLKKTLKFYPFLKLNRIAARLIASIFSIFVVKDTKALTLFLQSIMQVEHYSKHTLFFNFASQLIKDVFTPWIHKFNCLGVSIVFRGKLAVGGNSRKRSLKYKTGMLSSSSKYIKINRTSSIVRTKTGAVGFVVTVAW